MTKCLIVAVADNGAIGVNGQLPWHISEDLKFFKRTTMSCPVIMGRATFESIGKALAGRLNIVLSRSLTAINGAQIASSLNEAFRIAEQSLSSNTERCFVIGGAQIYSQAIELVDKLYITEVHTIIPNADAYFPTIDSTIWQETSRSELLSDPQSGIQFEFVEYTKR